MRFVAVVLLAVGHEAIASADEPISRIRFNRDVRPIISQKCFRCHGPDAAARKGDLRLDRREDAIAARALVANDPDASELIRRVTAEGDAAMPPPDSGLELSDRERDVLRRWIQEGAAYEPHWSLVPPVAAPIPAVKGSDGQRNPIDRFVAASLEPKGLALSPEAEKVTLLRRASLALTGLPPSVDEFDEIRRDTSPVAYERAVDRLLASPRFGERMATLWLDAARYADTNGYFGDNPRQIWPWRDWVISAFNRNQPFDQFTIEQIAGDLLPDATIEQKVATGFLRNHMVTDETGIIDEEYRVEYVADRTETTGTVWLGLTIGCARCHDHKYDPLPQHDYYRFFAFFNQGPETGLAVAHDQPPTLDLTTPAHLAELERLRAARSEADAALEQLTQSLREPMTKWASTAQDEVSAPTDKLTAHLTFEEAAAPGDGLIAPEKTGSEPKYEAGVVGRAAMLDGMQHLALPHEALPDLDRPWSVGLWINPTGSLNCILSKVEPTEARRGMEVLWAKGRLKVNLVHRWGADAIEVATRDASTKSDWHHVVVRYDGSRRASGLDVFVDGAPAALKIERDTLKGTLNNSEPLQFGRRDNGLGYYGHLDEIRVVRRAVAEAEIPRWFWSDRLRGILAVPAEKRDARMQTVLRDYYLQTHGDEAARETLRRAGRARQQEESYRAGLPKTLIMQDRLEPRATHLLKRGQYDQPGDVVQAGFPGALLSGETGLDAPRNRLDLARWIASPRNPLTARVAVNRLWQVAFGEGLVRTVNDFGSQGEPPTHPELLDWLAVRFMESGWDVKAMLRLILTSATFRQSSVPSPSLLAADPENRLLARGPRFRLSGEMLRDQALFLSGLLVERIGGPSVKPWQPPGLWEAVSYDGEASYVPDQDEGQWRRSVYSYWKRQSPPPALLIFDAPTRETCTVNRPRTNTPSQALVTLNDEAFVEAARRLAATTLADGLPEGKRYIALFSQFTGRRPTQREWTILVHLLTSERGHFASTPAAARKLVGRVAVPEWLGDPADVTPELAAWTALAQVLLNLDETLTSR